MNIKKCIIPGPKLPNFQKLPQTKNGKLYLSPTFQKVELRNSTFFQKGVKIHTVFHLNSPDLKKKDLCLRQTFTFYCFLTQKHGKR